MYKGWKVAVVGFLSMFTYSITAFGIPVFVEPVTSELHWSRTAFMFGIALHGLFAGVSGAIGGLLLDVVGGPAILVGGALFLASGLWFLASIHDTTQFYLLGTLVGIGLGLVGQVPVTAIVSQWFDRRRGKALATSMCGIAAGGMVAPMGCAILIKYFGWRDTFHVLALATMVLVPCVLLVVRKPQPHQVAREKLLEGKELDPGTQYTLKQALMTRGFWLIFVSFFLVWFYTTAVISNLVVYLEDCGYQPTHAAAALSAMLGLGLIGKFLYGFLGDWVGAFSAYIQLEIALLGAALCLSFLKVSPAFLVGLVLLHGLGVGGFLVVSGLVVTRRFGISGGIFGTAMLSAIPATMLAPVIPARFYDLGWGYKPFFILVAVCNLISVFLAIWLYFDYKHQSVQEGFAAPALARDAT